MDVQPPFLRPVLTEAQLEAKVLDNGIQNDRHSNRVSDTRPDKRAKTSNLNVEVLDVGTPQKIHNYWYCVLAFYVCAFTVILHLGPP